MNLFSVKMNKRLSATRKQNITNIIINVTVVDQTVEMNTHVTINLPLTRKLKQVLILACSDNGIPAITGTRNTRVKHASRGVKRS